MARAQAALDWLNQVQAELAGVVADRSQPARSAALAALARLDLTEAEWAWLASMAELMRVARFIEAARAATDAACGSGEGG